MNQRKLERISGQMREHLSSILAGEVSDPRLAMVTINRITLSKDASSATIYYSTVGDEKQVQDSIESMESAAGYLRRELAGRIELRSVPALKFVYDRSVERGEDVLRTMRELQRD